MLCGGREPGSIRGRMNILYVAMLPIPAWRWSLRFGKGNTLYEGMRVLLGGFPDLSSRRERQRCVVRIEFQLPLSQTSLSNLGSAKFDCK